MDQHAEHKPGHDGHDGHDGQGVRGARRGAPWRWAQRVLIGLVALAVLVVGGTQVALSTRLLRNLLNDATPSTLHIEYQSAWSLIPGHVHLRGLFLRAQQHDLQFVLRADEAVADIALTDLLRRTFHTTRIRVDGLSFRLRMRHYKPEVTAETLWGIPPLEGLPPIPYKDEQPEDVVSDARYDLWTFHLEDILVRGVREVWIEKARMTGDATVTGGFFLKPARRAQVEAQLQTDGLAVEAGEEPIADHLRGHIAVSLGPLDPRSFHRFEILGFLKAQLTLDGALSGLGVIDHLLPEGTSLKGQRGEVKLDLRCERGTLLPGSHALLGSPRVDFAWPEARAHAGAAVRFDVVSAGGRPRDPAAPGRDHATLELRLEEPKLSFARQTREALRATSASLSVLTDQLDLASPLDYRTFGARVQGGAAPDLAALQPLLPRDSDLRLQGGKGTFQLDAAGNERPLHGSGNVRLEGATFEFQGVRSRADARVDLDIKQPSRAAALDFAGSTVRVDHGQLAGKAQTNPNWWGEIALPSATFQPKSKALSLQVSARCKDARPILGLYGKLPGILQGLLKMEDLRVDGGLQLAPGQLHLDDVHARGDGADLRATYDARGKAKQGEALVKIKHISIGLDLGPSGTKPVLFRPTNWYEERLRARAASGDAAGKGRSPSRRAGEQKAARKGGR